MLISDEAGGPDYPYLFTQAKSVAEKAALIDAYIGAHLGNCSAAAAHLLPLPPLLVKTSFLW